VRKYFRIFAYAARDQMVYMPSFLVRNIFFVVIVFTFWSLWRVVFAGRPTLAGFSMVQMLWYLTFTETIELSKSRSLFQIQEEVKDGTLAVTLSRPYSYVLFHLARAMGESCVKIIPLLAEGYILATLFVGPLPGYFLALPCGLLILALGLLITNTWLILINLLSFWSEEVTPFYWIIQKLIFILGGLFIPIDLFPGRLSGIARLLPFSFSAYWPAVTMVSFSIETFLTGLAGSAFYAVALGGLAALLYSRGKRRVCAQGG
jgi:ABC-2 type transport system permease protein